MSWDRQKSTVSALPESPSLILWLMLGMVALIGSVLLFVLHANNLAGPFQSLNLWAVSTAPIVIWVGLICLRGWVYNSAYDKHQFESKEADYAQQEWVAWAGRHIAVLNSCVILPDFLTPAQLLQPSVELEQHTHQTRRISLPGTEGNFSALLAAANDALQQIPADLPLGVTLLTDSSATHVEQLASFTEAWQQNIIPAHPVPVLSILPSKSWLSLDERLQSPSLDIELVLIDQTNGQNEYSDALAALLLTSDDVVTKCQLSPGAKLLRPMPLDLADTASGLRMFFSTQTQALSTQHIVGDRMKWGESFYELLDCAKEHGCNWKTDQTHWLEKYAGVSGPFSPWLMAAVVADIVNLQKTDCLMLSSDGEQSFINTVTSGNQSNGNG